MNASSETAPTIGGTKLTNGGDTETEALDAVADATKALQGLVRGNLEGEAAASDGPLRHTRGIQVLIIHGSAGDDE